MNRASSNAEKCQCKVSIFMSASGDFFLENKKSNLRHTGHGIIDDEVKNQVLPNFQIPRKK